MAPGNTPLPSCARPLSIFPELSDERTRVVVSQADIDQIRGKMHRRVIELPVKRGTMGELKRCPAREGGIYHLKPRIPYDRYQSEADCQPTRARAILRLIDLCETPTRTVAITVTGAERQGDVWLVRFEKGERPELFDRLRLLRGNAPQAPTCGAPVRLADGRVKPCGRAFPDRDYVTGRPVTVCACGAKRPPEIEDDHGYTSRRSSAMKSEGEAVPQEMQDGWAEKAAERDAAMREEMRLRALRAIGEILPYAKDERERKRLRSARNQIAALGAPDPSAVAI